MFSVEPITEVSPPPWWRTAALIAIGIIGSLFSMVFSPAIYGFLSDGNDADALIAIIGLPVIAAGAAALGWRHRRPVAVVVAVSLVSVVLPIGNTLPFIALAAFLSRRRGPGAIAVACLVAASSSWVVIRDAMAQPRDASLIKTVLGPADSLPTDFVEISHTTVVLVILLGWGLTVALGWMVRNRREALLAKAAYSSARKQSSDLGEDLARRDERELIAREIHDALGHRLSLLNLHAGAMEANAGGDERIRESARLIRESAGTAMEDLRGLLGLLHAADRGSYAVFPLSELPTIVEECFGVGQQLSSSIFIRDAETAHPQLTNAVYRIVQELLTNARKHAPDVPVTLRVNGAPDTGIAVEASNPVAPATTLGPSGGRGLVGITERAELLGGSVRTGVDEQVFRVRVQLPWVRA